MEESDNKSFGSVSVVDALMFFSIFVILGIFFYANYYKVIENSRVKIANTYVSETLPSALETYMIDMGEYPSTTQGLDALITPPFGSDERWNGPYVTTGIVDPWGSDYQYVYPSTREGCTFEVWSLGRDRIQSADDIVNYQAAEKPKD